MNYYTNIGLFQVSGNKGNSRLYNYAETMKKFKAIAELKRRGYPLRVIREEFI